MVNKALASDYFERAKKAIDLVGKFIKVAEMMGMGENQKF